MIIEWLFLILAVSGAGLIWCLPFVMWFIYYYDTKTNKLKEKNMKSEQIKHSLSVGIKSIQSRVFDRETDEVISFVKIPIKDSGLVRCTHPVKDLEDIDINITWNENSMRDFGKDELAFARAILRKAQEK